MSDLRSDLFHPDGCVRGNINTRPYRVIFDRTCEHTKIIGAAIDIWAEDEASAKSYAERWLRLPQTTIYRVYAIDPATAIGPKS